VTLHQEGPNPVMARLMAYRAADHYVYGESTRTSPAAGC